MLRKRDRLRAVRAVAAITRPQEPDIAVAVQKESTPPRPVLHRAPTVKLVPTRRRSGPLRRLLVRTASWADIHRRRGRQPCRNARIARRQPTHRQ